MVLPSVR